MKREESILWWNSLTIVEKQLKRNQYYPYRTIIGLTGSEIERIYEDKIKGDIILEIANVMNIVDSFTISLMLENWLICDIDNLKEKLNNLKEKKLCV